MRFTSLIVLIALVSATVVMAAPAKTPSALDKMKGEDQKGKTLKTHHKDGTKYTMREKAGRVMKHGAKAVKGKGKSKKGASGGGDAGGGTPPA